MTCLAGVSKWPVSLVLSCVLLAVLGSARNTQAQVLQPLSAHRFVGVAIALVVDTQDPEAAGRIKVRFPWRSDDVESWARVSLPIGGNQTGLWALPEVGDEVIIAFEHGDVRFPVVLGSLWNGKDRPPR